MEMPLFAPRPPWSGPTLLPVLWVATALTRGPVLPHPKGSPGLGSNQEEAVVQPQAG